MVAHRAFQNEPESVVVRTPNWLGDLVMATALLQALLQRFPAARVDVIVRRGFEALPVPHRGDVLVYDPQREGPGRFGRRLRGRGYTHWFVLPPSFSSAWMAWRSATPYRIGYRGSARRPWLNPALAREHAPRSVHLSEEYLALLRPWGAHPALRQGPCLPADADWVAAHRPAALTAERPYLVVAPGAEYGPAKQWPLRHVAVVARSLSARGLHVVVAGLARDRAAGDRLLEAAGGGDNLCGQTDLAGLTALLAGARLVLSNDSGAMHLAAALGRPQIAVFGSTSPVWTGPRNPLARVVTRGEPCAPCFARRCRYGHTRCLQALSPALVLAEAARLLARTAR